MGWGLVAIAAGGLLSSFMSKSASEKATSAQLAAADAASAAQLEMFYTARADLEPWREAGTWALEKLRGTTQYKGEKPKKEEYRTTQPITKFRDGTGGRAGRRIPYQTTEKTFDEAGYNKALADWESTGVYQPGMLEAGPGKFEEGPGYQFTREQGLKAIERRGAARGQALSPSTSMALMEYGQGLASTEYDKFLSRYYQSLTPYQSLAGVGQTSAMGMGQMATQTGANLANIAMGRGQAEAGGYINRANIYGNMFQQGTNLAAQYYMYNKAGMFNQGSPGIQSMATQGTQFG